MLCLCYVCNLLLQSRKENGYEVFEVLLLYHFLFVILVTAKCPHFLKVKSFGLRLRKDSQLRVNGLKGTIIFFEWV